MIPEAGGHILERYGMKRGRYDHQHYMSRRKLGVKRWGYGLMHHEE
jgi:hypothetical protein